MAFASSSLDTRSRLVTDDCETGGRDWMSLGEGSRGGGVFGRPTCTCLACRSSPRSGGGWMPKASFRWSIRSNSSSVCFGSVVEIPWELSASVLAPSHAANTAQNALERIRAIVAEFQSPSTCQHVEIGKMSPDDWGNLPCGHAVALAGPRPSLPRNAAEQIRSPRQTPFRKIKPGVPVANQRHHILCILFAANFDFLGVASQRSSSIAGCRLLSRPNKSRP